MPATKLRNDDPAFLHQGGFGILKQYQGFSELSLYNASDGTDGSVTLAARTVCTILVASGGSSSKIYIAGGGIS